MVKTPHHYGCKIARITYMLGLTNHPNTPNVNHSRNEERVGQVERAQKK